MSYLESRCLAPNPSEKAARARPYRSQTAQKDSVAKCFHSSHSHMHDLLKVHDAAACNGVQLLCLEKKAGFPPGHSWRSRQRQRLCLIVACRWRSGCPSRST